MRKAGKRPGRDNGASIEEIAVEAKKAGMTYGQYVAKMYAPQIMARNAGKGNHAENTKNSSQSHK